MSEQISELLSYSILLIKIACLQEKILLSYQMRIFYIFVPKI